MPFEIGDLVYAKRHATGGYHQARIEMLIDNGRQYLVSWVHQVHRRDTLVPRCHVMGYILRPNDMRAREARNQNGGQDRANEAINQNGGQDLERETGNQNGGQDEADKAGG